MVAKLETRERNFQSFLEKILKKYLDAESDSSYNLIMVLLKMSAENGVMEKYSCSYHKAVFAAKHLNINFAKRVDLVRWANEPVMFLYDDEFDKMVVLVKEMEALI
jgi:hypothetical protein